MSKFKRHINSRGRRASRSRYRYGARVAAANRSIFSGRTRGARTRAARKQYGY